MLLTLLPAITQAHDVPALLSVESEPGAELCPDQRTLATRVEAILGRPLGTDALASALAIDVRFVRAPDGSFVARVLTRGLKPGQRLLRDTDATCMALGEAVSVAIPLLLDSALNEGEDAPRAAEPEPTTSVATSTPHPGRRH